MPETSTSSRILSRPGRGCSWAGTDGATKVMPGALSAAKQKGIEIHVLDSVAAVKLFNRMDKEGLVAAFHTGC